MSSSRLVRGAKTRMFACVCLICLLGALVYVFHGTQARLADVQKLANSCNQQQESLSAQLQVIFEYKLRLEKSLKKEKADHQQTKESCELKKKEDTENREKENLESTNKYEALVQQCKLQKSQYDDEKEALEKSLSQHKDEKKRLEAALELAKEETQKIKLQKENSLEDLKEDIRKLKKENEEFKSKTLPTNVRISHLEKENFQLDEELKKTKQSLVQCNYKMEKEKEEEKKRKPAADTSALEPPRAVFLFNNVSTPGVNPEAVETDTSSVKPPVLKSPQLSKAEEHVLQLPNKSTQESALPLAIPGHDQGNPPESQQQIPGPPEPPLQRLSHHDSQIAREDHAAELHDNNLGPLNPVMGAQDDIGGNMIYRGQSWEQQNNNLPAPHLLVPQQHNNRAAQDQQQHQRQHQQQDHNNAVEEDEEAEPRNFIRQRDNMELPRPGKGQQEHYHGGDYDKEQPEEEEDDEGEQIDYVQGNDQVRKEDQQARHHDHIQRHMDSQDRGIMVNPK